MPARSTPAAPNDRRSDSIATSPTCLPTARMRRRTGSPATKIWKNSSQSAFAGGGQRSQRRYRARGQDVSYELPVAFLDAANGATRTITLPEGKTLQVTFPKAPRTGRCCD